jgi:hypothetical protein
VTLPWRVAPAIAPDRFAGVRRQAIFECCKWDPQVEDVATLAPYPLVLRRETWTELTCALAILGLRRNSAGGFGSIIPMPRSGCGLNGSTALATIIQGSVSCLKAEAL